MLKFLYSGFAGVPRTWVFQIMPLGNQQHMLFISLCCWNDPLYIALRIYFSSYFNLFISRCDSIQQITSAAIMCVYTIKERKKNISAMPLFFSLWLNYTCMPSSHSFIGTTLHFYKSFPYTCNSSSSIIRELLSGGIR